MDFFSLDRMHILRFHSGIAYFHFSVVTFFCQEFELFVTFFHQRQKKPSNRPISFPIRIFRVNGFVSKFHSKSLKFSPFFA